jgi:hypothetical protein
MRLVVPSPRNPAIVGKWHFRLWFFWQGYSFEDLGTRVKLAH